MASSKIAKVFVYVSKKVFQIKNGVPHDLSRSVKSNVAASIAFVKSHVLCFQFYFAEQQVAEVSAFSQCVDGGVFYK